METLISIKDLFKKSFEMYKSRWWKMLLMGLVGWLGSVVIGGIFGLGAFATWQAAQGASVNLVAVLVALIGVLLLVALTFWVQLSLASMVKEDYAKAGVWDAMKMAWKNIGAYSWITILKGLAVLVGFILLIVPGIIFSVWLAFCSYAFIVDGNQGTSALRHSRELVRGYWWAVFGRLLVLVAVAMVVSLLTRVGQLINGLVVLPFGILYLYVLYEDLKRVKNAALPMKVQATPQNPA